MIPDLHLAMHGVAIKKHGSAADIASVAGLSEARAAAALKQGVDGGRVIETGGRYVLSPAGQMILASEYSRFCANLRQNATFMAAAAERFERINVELKQLITDWQTVELGGKRVPNDHADKAYDQAVIGRLGWFAVVLACLLGIAALILVTLPLAKGAQPLTGDVGWLNAPPAAYLLPLTGLTLPFVSYGGSSVTANFAIAALLLCVSQRANRERPL